MEKERNRGQASTVSGGSEDQISASYALGHITTVGIWKKREAREGGREGGRDSKTTNLAHVIRREVEQRPSHRIPTIARRHDECARRDGEGTSVDCGVGETHAGGRGEMGCFGALERV